MGVKWHMAIGHIQPTMDFWTFVTSKSQTAHFIREYFPFLDPNDTWPLSSTDPPATINIVPVHSSYSYHTSLSWHGWKFLSPPPPTTAFLSETEEFIGIFTMRLSPKSSQPAIDECYWATLSVTVR